MMTEKQIRDRVNEIACCFQFEYNGKDGGIDPMSETEFWCYYDGENQTVDSIDKAMNMPFVKGKRIGEILDKIDIISI